VIGREPMFPTWHGHFKMRISDSLFGIGFMPFTITAPGIRACFCVNTSWITPYNTCV